MTDDEYFVYLEGFLREHLLQIEDDILRISRGFGDRIERLERTRETQSLSDSTRNRLRNLLMRVGELRSELSDMLS